MGEIVVFLSFVLSACSVSGLFNHPSLVSGSSFRILDFPHFETDSCISSSRDIVLFFIVLLAGSPFCPGLVRPVPDTFGLAALKRLSLQVT